ncbi:MAG: GYD domain-containing protein [Chloroflexi bacterium]|nr:GYD domain-containing protein [Chloroflexota bacterium]MCI0775325.1 GYD domain-containing protein [Chloroflexota bacterium]MCI0835498.1 GYD domain-containing protein [Chloroflexota bacterium]MCI0874893.1 GYD domain-containing protein [Chloroflexota bacterium]
MPTYISLLKYTQQGVKDIKNSPGRIEAARKAIEEVGGKLLSYHVTMGQYDGIAMLELADDKMAATFALGVGKLGNVSTETMRAFTEEEFGEIVGHLG